MSDRTVDGYPCDKKRTRFVASKYLPNSHDFHKDPAWRSLRYGYLLDHGRQPLSRDDDASRATGR